MALFAVSSDEVCTWIAEGCPQRPEGTFSLKKVIAWRIQRTKEEESAQWCQLLNSKLLQA